MRSEALLLCILTFYLHRRSVPAMSVTTGTADLHPDVDPFRRILMSTPFATWTLVPLLDSSPASCPFPALMYVQKLKAESADLCQQLVKEQDLVLMLKQQLREAEGANQLMSEVRLC